MTKFIINIILLSLLMSQEISEGFVLFTPFNMTDSTITTYLVDENFNEINTWTHEYRVSPASMGYLMKDSTLWYPSKVQFPTMSSGGVGGRIQKKDWNNNVLWDYIISNDTLQHHHDIEPLPNGNILVLAWERKTLSEAQAMGRQVIETPLQQIWSEAIFEIQPIGLDSALIVWEWHLWDHLVQDVDETLDNYGIISEHPELLDVNLGQIGFALGTSGADNADWTHFNSIHYNEILDQIVLSSRTMGELYIIDHSTTTEEAASHSGGSYGKGGDFLYRWGNPQNYGRGNESDQILNSQHSVNWIESGYPGEGNLIIFNNFHFDLRSAVIEISPPINADGTYFINNNEPYGPLGLEWMFYNYAILGSQIIQSGAFRLENGNTYITKFSGAEMCEVTYDGDVVFEYSLPVNGAINRSKKYPSNYFQNITLGDVDGDGTINVLDIVIAVNHIVGNTSLLDWQFNNADLNGDGFVDILDIILLINQILD